MADSDVTALLATPELDREELMGQLVPLVYDELRRMAHRQLAREAGPRTLNTTGLVHEAYLKLIDEKTDSEPTLLLRRRGAGHDRD